MSQDFDPDNLPDEGNLSGSTLPDFVKKAPWYYKSDTDNLIHLRNASFSDQQKTPLSEFYNHGKSSKRTTVKWKPGCCKNCGSSTHKEFECTERPRKRNARTTIESTAFNEKVEKHNLSYAAKKDNFANYSNKRWWHDARGQYRLADKVRVEAKPEDEQEVPIEGKYGNSGFRNRMDTAKYISAIGNKRKATNDDDTWVKSGDESGLAKMAWEDYETINDKKKNEKEENAVKQQHERNFYESKEMLTKTIMNDELNEPPIPKSERYGDEEDKYSNGHSSIYGSYFDGVKWGYLCCKQTDKNCFCTSTIESIK